MTSERMSWWRIRPLHSLQLSRLIPHQAKGIQVCETKRKHLHERDWDEERKWEKVRESDRKREKERESRAEQSKAEERHKVHWCFGNLSPQYNERVESETRNGENKWPRFTNLMEWLRELQLHHWAVPYEWSGMRVLKGSTYSWDWCARKEARSRGNATFVGKEIKATDVTLNW